MAALVILLLLLVGFLLLVISIGKDSQVRPTSEIRVDSSEREEEDAWEHIEYGDPKELQIDFHISYKDAQGANTERDIRVKRFSCADDGSDAFLGAYCFMRKGWRNFRTIRINRCVDLATGEIIVDVPNYLLEKYEASPRRQLDLIRETFKDELDALVYVAKLDGRFSKKQKGVISNYLLMRSGNNALNKDEFIDYLKYDEGISQTQFSRCLGRIEKNLDVNNQNFYQAAIDTIETKKAAKKAAEKEVIPYIAKRLKIK
tara:strand:+ start:187 stop:963 length:777 start_codon:yes stop_codon:yes gene_type:complete